MRKWFFVAMALLFCWMVASGAMAATAGPSKGDLLTSKSLNSVARQIVQQCTTPGMTKFEKAVALYDWMIDNTVYRESTTNAHYVLRNGVASCGGYANAYKALLAKAGIFSKVIDGRVYTQGHTWNLVYLGGKWYHVDVRMGDHLAESEGRYRRFGMSDEQARLYYSFKKTTANHYGYNYAFKTGQLDSSIAYVRSAVATRARAGEKFFIIDLTTKGAPPELDDPFNRITVKNALQNFPFDYPGIPDKAKAALTLTDDQLLVRVVTPTYRVKKLTPTTQVDIVVEVADADFSAAIPLELGGRIQIEPAYATQQKLLWKSYQEKIALVNQSGRVKITGFGTARIKASTVDGSRLSCSFKVTVKKKQAG